MNCGPSVASGIGFSSSKQLLDYKFAVVDDKFASCFQGFKVLCVLIVLLSLQQS